MYQEDYMPFFFTDINGDDAGFDVDLAENIAKRLGVKLNLLRTAESFNAVVDMVTDGEADIGISCLSSTLSRAQKVSFSAPYFYIHRALLLNRIKSSGYKDNKALPELLNEPSVKLAALEDSSLYEFAQSYFPKAGLSGFSNMNSGLDMAMSGQVTGIVGSEINVFQVIKGSPILSVDLRTVLLENVVDPLSIAVRYDKPHLVSWLNLYIEEYMNKENSTLDALFDNYMHLNAEYRDISLSEKVAPDISDAVSPPARLNTRLAGLAVLVLVHLLWVILRRKSLSLAEIGNMAKSPVAVIIGIGTGIFLGITEKALSSQLSNVGDIFLILVKMCILPIILTALIFSIGKILKAGMARHTLLRMIVLFIIALSLGSATGITVGLLMEPGNALDEQSRTMIGEHLFSTEVADISGETKDVPVELSFSYFLDLVIPSNIFESLSESKWLNVMFFSILLGVALGLADSEHSQQTICIVEALYHSLLKIISWIMYVLPLGLCCILAGQLSKLGVGIFMALGPLVFSFWIAGSVVMFLMILSVSLRKHGNVLRPFIELKNILLIAVATSSQAVSLAPAISCLQERFKVNSVTANLVIPLGFMINRIGTVMAYSLIAVFISQLFDAPLGPRQLMFIFVGSIVTGTTAVGRISVSIIMMTALLQVLQLPIAATIAIVVSVGVVIEPVIVATTVVGNTAITTWVDDKDNDGLDELPAKC
jgi:proton glutamate symport protein